MLKSVFFLLFVIPNVQAAPASATAILLQTLAKAGFAPVEYHIQPLGTIILNGKTNVEALAEAELPKSDAFYGLSFVDPRTALKWQGCMGEVFIAASGKIFASVENCRVDPGAATEVIVP